SWDRSAQAGATIRPGSRRCATDPARARYWSATSASATAPFTARSLASRRARRAAPPRPLVELEIDGRRGAFRVTLGPAGTIFVQDALGELRLEELPRFPEPDDVERAAGGYAAPMPGKVLDVRVRAGE